MDRFAPGAADMMKQSPLDELYARFAPRPEDWPVLIAKTAELLKIDYDWTAEVAALTTPTMLVFADADSVRPDHVVEFFPLLGGGLRDAGWDGSRTPGRAARDPARRPRTTTSSSRPRSRRPSARSSTARSEPADERLPASPRACVPRAGRTSRAARRRGVPGDGPRPVSAAGAGRRRG